MRLHPSYPPEVHDDLQGGLSTRQRARVNAQVVYEQDGISVTIGDLRAYARLQGVWRHFGKEGRDDLLRDVAMEDLARYVWERKKARVEAETLDRRMASTTDVNILDVQSVEEEVQERMREYTAIYDPTTPNDYSALLLLAYIDVTIEHLRRAAAPYLECTDPAAQKLVRSINDQITNLMAASRQHQQILQIDVMGRAKARGAAKAEEVIAQVVRDTAKLLKEEILPIRHCGVLIGWVWWGFPTHPFQPIIATCPKCGARFSTEFPAEWKDRAISATDFSLDLETLDILAAGAEPHEDEELDSLVTETEEE
ncbi:MAG: hypothetical protein ACUVS5_12100 [Anaerolineae bacterium]